MEHETVRQVIREMIKAGELRVKVNYEDEINDYLYTGREAVYLSLEVMKEEENGTENDKDVEDYLQQEAFDRTYILTKGGGIDV